MRLTQQQQAAIRSASAEVFGQDVRVWLFGSRVDDGKKGGDIDLLISPGPAARDQPFAREIRLLAKLERALGERKIDVVIESQDDTRPIVEIARATGVRKE